MTGAVSTSAPTAVGVRAAIAGTSCRVFSPSAKVPMTRLAARSVARSAIAGRPAPGCSALKRRATGPTSRAATSACSMPRSATNRAIDAFGLFTGQVGYAANNVLFYVKGGAAVTSNDYRSVCRCNQRARWLHRRRHPLGWHGRRRPRIRLRPELVVRRRIQSPVHAGPYPCLHHAGRPVLRQRSRRPGRRSGHRPPELQVRWPDHREVLIFALLQTRSKPRASARGFFRCVGRPINHRGKPAKLQRSGTLDS